MTHRPHGETSGEAGGLGGFLKSLLSGIPWSERAEGEATARIDPPAGGLVRIDNSNGRTRVVGEDRDDVEVRVCKSARAESEEAAQRLLEEIHVVSTSSPEALNLEVEIPRRWNRRGVANLDVRVPRGCQVEITASNGKLSIEGLRGTVRARSSNGAVRVCDVVGDVEIQTSNAKVDCAGTRGRLVARSSNGKIELDEHFGSVDASTSNGLIRASLEALGAEGIQLSTSNGRIVLELPDEVDAEVDVRVDNGIIRNDRKLCRCNKEGNGRLRGTLGRGGVAIRLRTSNGSICMR